MADRVKQNGVPDTGQPRTPEESAASDHGGTRSKSAFLFDVLLPFSFFIFRKLTHRRFHAFAGAKRYGVGGTHFDAGATGKAVRYNPISFQYCLHHGGGTGSGAGFTGDAGVIIYFNLKEAYFLKKPANQPEGTKQAAPRPIDYHT